MFLIFNVLKYSVQKIFILKGALCRIQKPLLLVTPVAIKWTSASNMFARARTRAHITYKRLNVI